MNISGSVGDPVTATLANIGSGGTNLDTHVYFYFNGNLEWTYSSATLADKRFLQFGGSSTISPQIINTPTLVRVCVDPNNVVPESNESNNCLEYMVR